MAAASEYSDDLDAVARFVSMVSCSDVMNGLLPNLSVLFLSLCALCALEEWMRQRMDEMRQRNGCASGCADEDQSGFPVSEIPPT